MILAEACQSLPGDDVLTVRALGTIELLYLIP